MRIILASFLLLCSALVFGQDGNKKFFQETSKPFTPKVKPLDKSSVSYFVRQNVIREFSAWAKKDEFEPMDEYKKRVSINNQEKKRSELVTMAMEELVSRELAATRSGVTIVGDYDEPKGGFHLRHQKWGSFLVKVPIYEGREFKSNKDYLQIKDIRLGVKNDALVLQSCTVFSSRFTKTYPYNLLDEQSLDKASNPSIEFIDPSSLPDVASNGMANIKSPLPAWNFTRRRTGNDSVLAVVIGIGKYTYAKPVPAAVNNARLVYDLYSKALGILPENMIKEEDCTKEVLDEIFGVKGDPMHSRLHKMMSPKVKEVWVYYCGHGAPPYFSNRAPTPEEQNQTFLLGRETPTSSLFSRAYSLNDLYKSLAQLPVQKVNVFLDVCFSGQGVAKDEGTHFAFEQAADIQTDNKLLVFTAGTNNEVALIDKEGHYGLFTKVMAESLQNPENMDNNQDRAITYREWYNAIIHQSTGVPALARQRDGNQNPTLRGEERKNEVFIRY